MDGIKKPQLAAPAQPTAIEEPPIIQQPLTPYFSKREELYIPREETVSVEKIEQTFQKGKVLSKFFWLLLVLGTLALLSFLVFFLWKTYTTTKKMNVSAQQTTLSQDALTLLAPIIPSAEKQTLKGTDQGRINILLLGAAGEKKPGGNLTDTVMIMSIDTKNQKVALLSLPRDFYVPVDDSNTFTKINSLYKIGLAQNKGADLIKKAVQEVTGLAMNYYVVVDFDAFAKIIDNIHGINVMVERDIYDATYPGPNYSYETFALNKGAHLLGGDVALKYVRERHDDPEGDFGRAKRQQQVIQAVKSRLFSMQTLFNVVALSNVLDTLGENIKTDMAFEDIEQFIKLSKTVDTQNITNVVVDAWKPDSLLKVSHVMMGNDRAFILIPRVGNYSEIKDLALNIFDQAELQKRQAEISQENASISITNQSSDSELANKIKKLLTEKLEMKNVQITAGNPADIQNKTSINSNSVVEKIFTLDELIRKLPATLDAQKISDSADISITLGNDLIETYKYEEDTMQDLQNADDRQLY
jgi:LCP family protein required for cell wall assembly